MAQNYDDDDDGEPLTAADVEEYLGGRFLSGAALGNRTLKLRINEARRKAFRGNNGVEYKPLLLFAGSNSKLVLNKTNLGRLETELGLDPTGWKGAVVSVSADYEHMYNNKPALKLEVLNTVPRKKPEPQKRDPDLDDEIPPFDR
jgi:hypothetical protein